MGERGRKGMKEDVGERGGGRGRNTNSLLSSNIIKLPNYP